MEEKYSERVELNLHTYMSGFVSVIRPREAIETAVQMGHRAVGITDFESVQSFLEVATCHQKHRDKIKVIYGIRTFANDANVTILAKNQAGLKALYQVVSTGEITPEQRENLLVASAYWDGELTDAYFAKEEPHRIMEIVSKYDYIELTPPSCNGYPKDMNQKLYALGKSLGKPVVAVSDCNYIDPKDRLSKEVLNCFRDVPASPTRFYSTQEMLDEFSGLGSEAAYEVVVTNPNKIADSIEFVDPLAVEIPDFIIPGDLEEIRKTCEEKLEAIYGKHSPQEIRERLDKELSLLGKNSALYWTAYQLVKHLQAKGAKTGYRSLVGSALISYLLNISDINPLPAHYHCDYCHHTEFVEAASGYDLMEKCCPNCGKAMRGDGHNIPYEISLGLNGEKDPNIDIQTTTDMCDEVGLFLRNLIGIDRVVFAGECREISRRLAGGYAKHYAQKYNLNLSDEEIAWITESLDSVKREDIDKTCSYVLLPEGMQWEDITPLREVQRPKGGIDKATHMEYFGICYYHSPKQLPSLDVLHNDKFDMLRDLFAETGVNPEEINYNDPKVYQLFKDNDADEIPEFNTSVAKEILRHLDDVKFSTLLRICGMLHGTNVWKENAAQLISDHSFSELISDRESVFWTLQKCGIDRENAFGIMEDARKGKLPWEGKHYCNTKKNEEWLETMQSANVPQWYIDSLCKVYYLPPRSHVAHYTKLAVTMAWFKVYYPEAFYNTVLKRRDTDSFADWTSEELQQKLNDWTGTLVSKTF